MPKKVFLVTVGTSLLKKFGESEEGKYYDVKAVDNEAVNNNLFFEESLNKEIKNEDINQILEKIYSAIKAGTGTVYTAFGKLYKHFKENGNIAKWLERNSKSDTLKKISAEIKTLLTLYPLSQANLGNASEVDKVILFPTLTLGGVLVAAILSEFLPKAYNNKIQVTTFFTQNLGSTKGENFREGLKNFIGNIYRTISENNKKGYTVYILASGGYKSVIPYCTIAGLLTGVPVYYIYEDSDQLVELPSLPIGIQKELFKPYANILKILENSHDTGECDSLPEKLKNLFVKENGSLKPTEFFNIAFDIYNSEFYKSPLQVESEGMSVLRKLRDDEPKLLEYFKQIIKICPYLWIGDKVPELVDHGLYHHDNLFVIADRVLSLIDRNNQHILKPLDVFLILATIFFHDWGHVVAHVDGLNRTLLPTEVRVFHHILSYKRIEEQKDRILKRIFSIENNGKQLSDTILYPIALLCAYHRKSMPLNKDEAAIEFPLSRRNGEYEKFAPLATKNCNFDGAKITGESLAFLESLFRVIDSIDTQFVRAGSVDELTFKFRNFKMEIKEEEKRLENLKKLTTKEGIDCYNSVFEKLKGCYQARANAGKESQGSNDLKTLYKNLEEDHLMFLYVESKLRIMMKDEQREHFLRHMFLDVPVIKGEKDGGGVKITVEYKKSGDFDNNVGRLEEEFPDDEAWIEEKVENLTLGQLVNGISSDYEKVKKILNNKGVSFDFIAKDQQN